MQHSKKNLTAQQAIFLAEYVTNGRNATQAYLKAYPACKSAATAAVSATRLLRKDNIASRLVTATDKLVDTAVSYAGIDKAWVMSSLKTNFERAMQAEQVTDREGNPTGEYTYQGNVANKALDLIGKEIGMFVNRVAGPDGSPLPAPVTNVYNGIDFALIAKKAKGKK